MAKYSSSFIFVSALTLMSGAFVLSGCGSGSHKSAANQAGPGKKDVASNVQPKPTGPANPYGFVRPEHIMGVYMTAWVAGNKKARERVLDMVKQSGLNSVVIDVRDEGANFWKMGIPDGDKAHATQLAVPDPEAVMKDCKDRGIYPIARVACFRDNFIPKVFPNRAVQTTSGEVWHDRGGYKWLDPYNKLNWDYMKQIINVAVKDGFPEIQLDYVRFASEGKSGGQFFPAKSSYPVKDALKADVIQAFAQFISDDLKPMNVPVSADVFGIISSSKSDQGIGQELVKVSQPLDALSPMVYPSHFHLGEYGIAYPNAQPYAIIKKSMDDYQRQVPGKAIRPWLQAFNLRIPGKPDVKYGPSEIADEVRAVRDAGYHGFFLWNAGNKYELAALTAAANVMKSPPQKPITGGDASKGT